MRHALALALVAVVCGILSASPVRAAESPEWPGLFRQRCGACHEGAGKLAEQKLAVVDGVLIGRDSGRDIREFLADHSGGVAGDELATIYRALLRGAQGGGRFKARCAICHGEAEALARERLIMVDGRLQGRYSGRDIATFLLSHGTRDPEEAAFFESLLRRFATAVR